MTSVIRAEDHQSKMSIYKWIKYIKNVLNPKTQKLLNKNVQEKMQNESISLKYLI
tara:strand:- start:34 stop:198 length:165 start_codon:yes stop_codon:yes gene_type:complete